MATSFSNTASITSDSIKNAFADAKLNNNNNFYLQNTAFLLKADKTDHDSGRLDLNTGNLKRNDEYFKDRSDFSDKIDFFRGANFINADLYRGKSPSADYGRPYPDLYSKSDAKTDYFRVAEYYRKNSNEYFYRDNKSPELNKKNGERSPGLDFLRPKSPKDGYKSKLDEFRRNKDTDGEFLKPNCGAEVYNDKSDYYSEVKSSELYRKSPDYASSERCSVILNNSDNSSEVSHMRLKSGEDDYQTQARDNGGVMNIVNSGLTGYHGASSSPPVSADMKFMPPSQHHHHHHHHHQVRSHTFQNTIEAVTVAGIPVLLEMCTLLFTKKTSNPKELE